MGYSIVSLDHYHELFNMELEVYLQDVIDLEDKRLIKVAADLCIKNNLEIETSTGIISYNKEVLPEPIFDTETTLYTRQIINQALIPVVVRMAKYYKLMSDNSMKSSIFKK